LKSAAAIVVVALGCALAAGRQAPAEDARAERLAALGKLWARVKYFHPYLAYKPVDWDGALVEALPKAAAASTSGEYAAAVDSMLARLGDPATRVVRPAAITGAAPGGKDALHRIGRDGILEITVNPETLTDSRLDADRLRQAASEIARAKAVIFDLRRQQAWAGQAANSVGLAFVAGGFNSQLALARLRVPGQRSRMHAGLASPFEGGSVFFYSAFQVKDGAVIEPANGAREKPVVFLADETSVLPPIAPVLQAAGKASIVAQGGVSDASLVEAQLIRLPLGVAASLRLTELVYEDGTTGLEPNLLLPPGSDEQALAAARRLALNPGQRRAAQRPRLPVYGIPRREEAYPSPEYPRWEHRLMAAFRIWAAFEHFFAYRDLMNQDWDAVLVNSLAKLEQASDARDYALALAEMVARVGDSHATVVGSRSLAEYFGVAQPPIRTRMIEGLPVVTSVFKEGAAISPGDIVVSVDGENAAGRLERMGRYVAASTPQSRDHILMQRWLGGAPGTKAGLIIRGRDNQVREVVLTRNGSSRLPWRNSEAIEILPGNIGYADLDRLPPERVDEMFEKLGNTRGIVFDMRGYPQGTAWLIAPRLTGREQVVAARFRRPLALAPGGVSADVGTLDAAWNYVQYLPETGKRKYTGPTVMLIDERAMSQAEHMGLFLEAANGTKFIGSRTAGANGDVSRFTVPGGITISFSGHDVRHADGRQLQRIGLVPDIEVKPTIAGIRAGRDEVLARALRYFDELTPTGN
jgi:C-terminal processing protease CtpA/Prc